MQWPNFQVVKYVPVLNVGLGCSSVFPIHSNSDHYLSVSQVPCDVANMVIIATHKETFDHCSIKVHSIRRLPLE